MRTFLTFSGLLAGLAATAFGAGTMSALDAVKQVPKEQRKFLARIEGRDGAPVPERWHILVHDKSAENGLREFVVENGALIATRSVSQFAENLAAEQVIGDAVKCDSDRAARTLQEYADANGVRAATISYQLRKDGAKTPPLWKIVGYDENGRELGSLVLTGKGAVASHEGFPQTPEKPPEEAPRRERPRTFTSAPVYREAPAEPLPPPPPTRRSGLFERIFRGGDAR